MSWREAAAMITPGITAYHLINHLLTIQPTDTVMIEGASGSVGTILVQLLNQKGILTFASTSKKNESRVRKLGVPRFFAYDQEAFAGLLDVYQKGIYQIFVAEE